jgi:hypothetical protein
LNTPVQYKLRQRIAAGNITSPTAGHHE